MATMTSREALELDTIDYRLSQGETWGELLEEAWQQYILASEDMHEWSLECAAAGYLDGETEEEDTEYCNLKRRLQEARDRLDTILILRD